MAHRPIITGELMSLSIDKAKDNFAELYGGRFLSLKDYSAVGDGITDDYDAIMATHDALPPEGGAIYAPFGNYLHNTAITFTKRVFMFGDGTANIAADTSPSQFLKGAGINGDGFVFTGQSVKLENIAFKGESGNGGDGLVIKAKSSKIYNVGTFSMGNDGARIGTDSGGENSNVWHLDNLITKSNGRDGLHISEGSGGGADSNAGYLGLVIAQSNGRDGVHLGNTQLNTFDGIVSEGNTRDGIHYSTDANWNTSTGGDFEGNGRWDMFFADGATENTQLGGVLGLGNKIEIENEDDGNIIIALKNSPYNQIHTPQIKPHRHIVKGSDPDFIFTNETINQIGSGRIRFAERLDSNGYQGMYVHYDGSTNKFHIGSNLLTDEDAANDVPNFTIDRGTGKVTFSGDIALGVGKVIEGSVLVPVPATASSTGILGQIAIDATHIYRCTATDTWTRAAITFSTW